MTIVYLGCAWLLGIYLGSLLRLPPVVPIALAAGCIAVAVMLRGRPRAQLVSLCLLPLCFGLWRYDLARPALLPGPLAAYNDDTPITFRGLVVNEPVPRDRWADLHVSVHELKADDTWMPMRGQVLVQVPSFQTYRYGDELEISGKLQTPPESEEFSYRVYLARQGIHSLLRYPHITLLQRDQGQSLLAFLYCLKRRTQSVIAAILPEPQAALLTGILLGSDEGIPPALMDQFRAAGVAHIIAISGFNITIISASLVKVFSRLLQRYVALVVAIGAIALYAILVGAEPPVVRAAIMGGLAALALIAGRQAHALTSLVLAAWLMTAWRPFTLWEIGFQLSFAASLGLILYSEKLRAWTQRTLGNFISSDTAARLAKLLDDTLLISLTAQVTTLPLLLSYFHQFSLLSLVANTLVVPVQPTIMYLGSTVAMAGLLYLPLGRLLGWVAWLFLTYTIRIVELIAGWVGTSGAVGEVHPAVLLAYYGLLTLFTLDATRAVIAPRIIWRWLRRGFSYKVAFAALVVALALVWTAVAGLPDGRLHVTFIDVGQGDAILVQTPTGRNILIDGGPSPDKLLTALGHRLPFWDRRIDIVLLSHPHEDHLLGLLPMLERYQVRQVLVSDNPCRSTACERWQQLLRDRSIPLLIVQHALQIDLGDGPYMQVFPQIDDLDSAGQTLLVARLSWQGTSFLCTGDLGVDGLLNLNQAGWPLSCTVLKVPHHGSDSALDKELLAIIRPKLAVISVGAENRFGHPAQSTLQLLAQEGITTLRTDQAGDIEVIVDASLWQIKTQHASTQ